MSRSLVANLFYSVDGVASDPHLWQFDSFDAGLGQVMTEALGKISDNVLGRVSYEEWAGYWPEATDGPDAGFAQFINGTPKHVATNSLKQEELTWENSSVIDGDLIEYLTALKQQDGGDIAIQGSLSVVRQCVQAGIIDELTLIIHPVLAGKGERLFDGVDTTRLELLRSHSTENGNLVVTYGPKK